MHVEHDIHVVFLRPREQAVGETEAAGVVGEEELVVEGEADGVESEIVEEADVVFGDVAFVPLMPEVFGGGGADEFGEVVLDLARGLRAVFEFEHVSLRLKPVAEVHTAEQDGLVVGGDDVRAVGVDELGKRGGEESEGEEDAEEHEESVAGAARVQRV